MKALNSKLLLISLLIFLPLLLSAQEKPAILTQLSHFKGVITYDVTYTITNNEDSSKLVEGMPTELEVYYSGDWAKYVFKSDISTVSMITNQKDHSINILTNFMGQKAAHRYTPNQVEETLKQQDKVSILSQTDSKDILGYNCKKLLAIHNQDTLTLYTTDKLKVNKPNWHTIYGEVPTVLLAFTYKEKELYANFLARKIERLKLRDEEFAIPEDYENSPPAKAPEEENTEGDK